MYTSLIIKKCGQFNIKTELHSRNSELGIETYNLLMIRVRHVRSFPHRKLRLMHFIRSAIQQSFLALQDFKILEGPGFQRKVIVRSVIFVESKVGGLELGFR